MSSPVMIRATTRPRRSSGARSAAKGIMTCPATDETPTASEARANTNRLGARAQATQDRAATPKRRATRGRRGCRSPKGTMSRRPAA